MAERALTHSFIYSTETLIFSILALLLLAYYRGLGRQYVKFWMLSLSALAVNQFALACESIFYQQDVGSALDISIALLRQISQYLHILFLIFGIYAATKQKDVTQKTLVIGISSALFIGCFAALFYAFRLLSD